MLQTAYLGCRSLCHPCMTPATVDSGLCSSPCCTPLRQARAEAALAKELTAADTPLALRLLLNDAGTYDAATKTGGCDGSIVLP